VFRDLPKRMPANLPLGSKIGYSWLPGAVRDPGIVERRWPHVPGKLSVLYIGRLENSQKRVLMLPQIARQVIDSQVPAHFDVVGAGPERDNLRAKIRELGLDEFFTIQPAAGEEEVRRLMQTHDVFLLPSAFEGLPVALIEAISCRMAAVVSDLPSGIWEMVDRESAMIVPAHGHEGYAEAIIRLWLEPGLGLQLGERARKTFLKGFSLEILGPKWLELLGVKAGIPPIDIEWPAKIKIRQPLFVRGPLHRPAFRPLRRFLAALKAGCLPERACKTAARKENRKIHPDAQ
jgi:glycosyltransferase involved in cell wall biosynthesis